MIEVLCGLIVLLTVGYLVAAYFVLRHLKDRDALERDERARDARERDTAAARHAQQVEHLVTQIREAYDARTDEIGMLLQRIQAPQMAVMQHQVEQAGPDENYPLSDEEAAKETERQRAIEVIERMENEGLENLIR